jgi:DNA-binding NtrC family response regulator
VLIVDEQEMIRTILASLLQSWGFTTHIARDLLSACRMVVSDGPYDAIICNYDLPDGNAFNLVDWMHEQELVVPTIVPYGALPPMEEPQGNVKLLSKPYDPVELRQAIERAASESGRGNLRTTRRRSRMEGRIPNIQHPTSYIQ